jgi:uncharacterized protein (TIGR02246 family)
MDAHKAIERTVIRLVAAWNMNDARGFGALFTLEARYTGTDGILRQGRPRIEAMLRERSEGFRVSIDGPISVDVRGFRGKAEFHWVSVPREEGRGGIIHCVLVMGPDGWCIDALQNTDSRSA